MPESATAEIPANPFWDFSLAVYGKPGVAPAVLALQDRHGLDVNLLLLCCWAGSRGRGLGAAELRDLIATLWPWQEQVIRPLRAVRRWLKDQTLAPAGPAGALREAVLARELDGERLEQLILAEALSLGAGEASAETAAASLKAYLAALEIEADSVDMAGLAALLTASFPDLPPLEASRLLG